MGVSTAKGNLHHLLGTYGKMWISERILYLLAKQLGHSDLCLDATMKDATSDEAKYHLYRSEQFKKIASAAVRHGISFRDKSVLDFGCNDGALAPRFIEA